MKLYLIQHAKSLSKEEDPNKPLSREGWAELNKISTFLAEYLNLSAKKIFHSGKTRAQDTAEALDEFLSPPEGTEKVEGMSPNDPVEPWIGKLHSVSAELMLVGHLPFLNNLANSLLGLPLGSEAIEFKNAGIICLEKKNGKWKLSWKLSPEDIISG